MDSGLLIHKIVVVFQIQELLPKAQNSNENFVLHSEVPKIRSFYLLGKEEHYV